MTVEPGSAVIVAVDRPGSYTVAVAYCLCGVPVGECDCAEMVTDWLHRFEQMSRTPVPYGRTHR